MCQLRYWWNAESLLSDNSDRLVIRHNGVSSGCVGFVVEQGSIQ
jgi:hypothetical protein